MNLAFLENRNIFLLASGGLDTMTIIDYLAKEVKARVTAGLVDLGQAGEDMQELTGYMKDAGAVDAIILDGRDLLCKWGVRGLIRPLAVYGSGYGLSTALARAVKDYLAWQEMTKRGMDNGGFMAHGATPKGNDQTRFKKGMRMLCPTIKVIGPWNWEPFRAKFPGRQEMFDHCVGKGLHITSDPKEPCSSDKNVWGCTWEGRQLGEALTPTDFVKLAMSVHPKNGLDHSQLVTITFEKGWPTHIDGRRIENLFELVNRLNDICGPHGYGVVDMFEDRYFGDLKCRGVYEHAALKILQKVYDAILQVVMDRQTRASFNNMSQALAWEIYSAEWFSPMVNGKLAFFDYYAKFVTGTVSFELFKGNAEYRGMKDVPYSLYDRGNVTFESGGGFNQAWSEPWLEIECLLPETRHHAGQVEIP
ncbi:MAG: argininosuccinate synthase [Candidatus Moranbacteria bacterium]|nr:argininosuccinate synthase [Candidatus Moranbacteria bacterium]